MNQNIIITGATGFVGSNLTRFLLSKKEYNVYLIVRVDSNFKNLEDILDKVIIFTYDDQINNLIEFFTKVKPQYTFHLASLFIAEHESYQIDALVQSNLTFGLHILEAMHKSGVKNLINTGTSWQHYNNDVYNPVCLYAATKQAFESLIEYYVDAEGFRVITLKLFDTYGETDTRPKLINLLNKFADENVELKMSPGNQQLNLVHIDDVCEAFYIASNLITEERNKSHKKFMVASDEHYSLKEIVYIYESISGKKINVTWAGKPYRKREVMELWSSGISLPNWKAKIKLEQGFSRIIKQI